MKKPIPEKEQELKEELMKKMKKPTPKTEEELIEDMMMKMIERAHGEERIKSDIMKEIERALKGSNCKGNQGFLKGIKDPEAYLQKCESLFDEVYDRYKEKELQEDATKPDSFIKKIREKMKREGTSNFANLQRNVGKAKKEIESSGKRKKAVSEQLDFVPIRRNVNGEAEYGCINTEKGEKKKKSSRERRRAFSEQLDFVPIRRNVNGEAECGYINTRKEQRNENGDDEWQK